MPARRKKLSGKKLSAQAAPEGMTQEDSPVEKRAPITQVVEVIEEDIIPISAESPDTKVSDEPKKESVPADEKHEEAAEKNTDEDTSTEPSRKSMVEELYTTPHETKVMPEISMHRGNRSGKPFMVWAIVTIIIAVLTGSILYAVSRKGSTVQTLFVRPTPTPTPAPEPTPTPTPAQVDKTSFTIQVLNGGGTPGAAGKMKTFLEEKGYKVSGTGNSPGYTFELTEIHGKSTMTDAVANLKADLKDSYSLGTVDTSLDASASADVQVIVGKE